MSEILSINDSTVKIGDDNGAIIEAPLASLQFSHPQVGDMVRIYKDDTTLIIKRSESGAGSAMEAGQRKVNKVAYVLLCFFFGVFGVHRFMRGQIGLGILMILVGWATLGIWLLVDFIISLVKLSDYPGDDFIFTANGRFAN